MAKNIHPTIRKYWEKQGKISQDNKWTNAIYWDLSTDIGYKGIIAKYSIANKQMIYFFAEGLLAEKADDINKHYTEEHFLKLIKLQVFL
jgi:hypothetical protein